MNDTRPMNRIPKRKYYFFLFIYLNKFLYVSRSIMQIIYGQNVTVMLVWNEKKFIVRFVMGVLYRVMFMSHMKWFSLCNVCCNTPMKILFVVSVFRILFFITSWLETWIHLFFLSQITFCSKKCYCFARGMPSSSVYVVYCLRRYHVAVSYPHYSIRKRCRN